MKTIKIKKIKRSVPGKLALRFTFILVSVVIGLILLFSRIQMLDFLDQRNTEIKRWVLFIDRVAQQHIDSDSEKEIRVPKFLYYSIFKVEQNKTTVVLSNTNEVPLLPETERRSEQYSVKNETGAEVMKIYYFSTLAQKINCTGNEEYYIQVWFDLGNDSMYQSKQSLPKIFLISFIPVFLICYLIAYLIARRTIKPVVKMTNAARQISSSTLDSLLPQKNDGDELDLLAETFNNLFIRLKKDFDRKRQFTSDVSHELKTPLTAISGYAEVIENGIASETDVKRFAQGIHTNANRLIILINDIIRLSELDSAEEEIDVEELDLYAMAKTCVEMLEPSAEKHHVSICANGEPCPIYANKMMMEELLYNLCDNAIRYNNENGSVEVSVKKEKEQAILSVKDTGIGISKEHQERIFERFYRVDKSRSKSTGGTGLGLSIVKHAVAYHKAEISLESTPGKGTTITIQF